MYNITTDTRSDSDWRVKNQDKGAIEAKASARLVTCKTFSPEPMMCNRSRDLGPIYSQSFSLFHIVDIGPLVN